MGEIQLPIFFNVVVFLAVSVIGGLVAVRLRLPTIVGYIIGGVILGLFLGGRISADFLSHFASLGIILLLFVVGLDMDVTAFRRFGRFTILAGLLQITITTVILIIVLFFFNFSLIESLFAGVLLSLSSTAVVAKIIQDRREEESLFGQLAIGILVLQDLAAIPLIIIVSAIGSGGDGLSFFISLVLGILKAMGVLLLMYILGSKLAPYIFLRLARASREILNLFTIFFIFAAVYTFSSIGLSASVAAFITGVLIGQTREHYHIFSQIRPLRDLFAILFFVSLGASVNFGVFLTHWPAILIFSILLIVIKGLVVFALFLFFKLHSRTSFSLALSLAHVGEFAFIILNQGASLKIFSQSSYQIILPAIIISLGLAPFLIVAHEKIYTHIKKVIKKRAPALDHYLSHTIDRELPHIDVLPIKNHVVICGYGRLGGYIASALLRAKIPHIAIDYNYFAVETAKKQGVNIIYGDPTNVDILDYAQCEQASCLIAAVPGSHTQKMIILNAKRLNPKITIFTRVEDGDNQRKMKDLGAEIVVQPEFEAAVSIVRKILSGFRLSNEDIISRIKKMKVEHGMD